jgi:SNF2 family DNA or RNA helicase
MKNGLPINIKPLLKAIEHPVVADSSVYDRRYCDAKVTRFSRWDTSGAKNLDELHTKIKDRMLRRTKAECLDLPPLTRVMREAEATDSARKEYDHTFSMLRADYMARVSRGEICDNAEALVMMGHLRHAGSCAKIDSTVDIVDEVYEQGGSVVVFTNFLDVANRIMIKLAAWRENHVALLVGEIHQTERTRRVDDFQSGKLKVLICTYGTGGVGINLHAAQTIVLHDRPWTPADVDQAESRLHRYGQEGDRVTSIWVQYGALDVEIDDMLDTKSERIAMVMEGKRKTMRGTESVIDVASRVLSGLFAEDGGLL